MASVRCPECKHKQKIPTDHERSTIRCSECGHKIPLEDDEDERPVKKKKKKKAATFMSPVLRWVGRVDLSIQIAIGIWVLVLLISCLHPKLIFGPIGYGLILILVANVLFLIIAFNDSPVEFLLCLFLPIYSLYYLVTHWEETKVTLYMHLFGMLVCASSLCALPVHLVVAAVKDAVADNRGRDLPPAKDRQGNLDDNDLDDHDPPIAAPPAKITGDPAMDRILDDFQSKDFKARDAAMKTLMAMKPNQHRAAVVQRLNQLAKAGDLSTKHRFLEVMKTWATRDDTQILIGYLNEEDAHARNLALQALAETRDERAVDAVVQNLVQFKNQWHAEQVLRKIGPPAETAVLKMLNDPQQKVRQVALNLMIDVGTQRSIPTLQAIATNGPFEMRGQAEGTIKAIQARTKK